MRPVFKGMSHQLDIFGCLCCLFNQESDPGSSRFNLILYPALRIFIDSFRKITIWGSVFFSFFGGEILWSDGLIDSLPLLSVCAHTLISSSRTRKNSQKTSIKARYAVQRAVSGFESERRRCLSVTRRTAVWGQTFVKSSTAVRVILRAGEVLGRAEMLLIRNGGAIHADQCTDLSPTFCMMFCLAPSTSTHQRSINHQHSNVGCL